MVFGLGLYMNRGEGGSSARTSRHKIFEVSPPPPPEAVNAVLGTDYVYVDVDI